MVAGRRRSTTATDRGEFPMTETAIIAIASAAGMVGFFLVIQLPDLLEKWGKTKTEATNAAMKQQMIERGFSPEEIVQVLNAGTGVPERPAAPRVPARRE